MKALFSLCLLLASTSFSQDTKTISLRTRGDMGQDTYVRIMHTADSLFEAYQDEPFQFEKTDGSCCDKGLLVILQFYKMALKEQPKDADALDAITTVNNYAEDEELCTKELNFGPVLKKGDAYYQEGNYRSALKLYERALVLSPDSKAIKKKIKSTKKSIKKHPNS